MKKNLIIHFILVLLLKIGVTGCTEETISMNADRMPDETAMDNIAGALRNTTTLTNKAFIELTEGDESATEEIFYSLSQSAGSRLTVTAVVNEKLVEDYNEENNSKLSPVNRVTLVIMIVFGCRGRELRESLWNEWDFKEWIWTVPKEHSKNGREIIRPIPPQIRQWLVNLRAIAEEEGTERLLNGEFSKQTVMSTVGSRFWRKFRHEKSWCLHDLRRVLATNLNDMGVDPHVVEQLLGHTLPGVMGIYNRSQYLAAKLDALTRWVDYLNSLIRSDAKEESSNV